LTAIAPPLFLIVKIEFPWRSHVPVSERAGGTGVGVGVRVGVGVGLTQKADAEACSTPFWSFNFTITVP
jgi:hypothetical protein